MNRVLFAIVCHEWKGLLRDRTAFLLLGVLGFTIGYAITHGVTAMRTEQTTYDEFLRTEAQEQSRQREQNRITNARIDRGELREIPEWSNDPALTPLFSLWEFRLQRSAVMPIPELSFLSIGQRDVYPLGYKPQDSGQYFKETIPSVEQNENPLCMMLGHFDLAFVILYLLPLFIIAISYDLAASEGESGLLSLLLSQPVSLHLLLLGKLLVRGMLIVAGTLALVVTATTANGVAWYRRGVLPLFLLWLVAIFVYSAFWLGLSFLVNSFRGGAAGNAVTLVVFWLGLTLLLPATIRFVAKATYPIPLRSELRNAKRDAIMQVGVDYWEQGAKELDDENSRTSRIVARYLADNPDLQISELPLPGQKFTFRYFDFSERDNVRNHSPKWRWKIHQQRFHLVSSARTAEIERIIAPIQNRFDEEYRRQHRFFEIASYTTPQAITENIFSTLSGSSVAQHDRFLRQVESAHREWRYWFTKRSLRSELLRPDDFNLFPYFAFQPQPVSEIQSAVIGPLLALLGMCVLTIAAGVIAVDNR